MHRRRTIVAAGALALGVIAGAIAYTYLSSVQQRAYHGAQLTSVYIAEATIPRGTTATAAESAGLIKRTEIPAQFRPYTAIASLNGLGAEVAANDIAPNQVLVSGEFTLNQTAGGAAAQQIPKGDVAITISVDAVHGVAGLVAPGDRVDMLVELTKGEKETTVYQNVPVLAIGSVVASSGGPTSASGAPQSGLITFAVPLDAAERIAMIESGNGSASGSLYLALVPPGASAATAPQIAASSLIPATPVPS